MYFQKTKEVYPCQVSLGTCFSKDHPFNAIIFLTRIALGGGKQHMIGKRKHLQNSELGTSMITLQTSLSDIVEILESTW